MNVTHTIAHENQTINHYLHKFPEVLSGISFTPLSSRHFNIHGLSIEGRVFDEFVELFHNTNVRLQRGNANQNAMVKKKRTRRSIRVTLPTGRANEQVFVSTIAFSFVLTFIIAILCSPPPPPPWKSNPFFLQLPRSVLAFSFCFDD